MSLALQLRQVNCVACFIFEFIISLPLVVLYKFVTEAGMSMDRIFVRTISEYGLVSQILQVFLNPEPIREILTNWIMVYS